MPSGKKQRYVCRKNCKLDFTHNKDRIQHENEKCVVYGGVIDKRKKTEFKQACDQSLEIDGTLLHASKIFQKLVTENTEKKKKENESNIQSTVINNNDHSVTNNTQNINNNSNNTNVFLQLSKSEWDNCSKKEKNEINAVLRLFRDSGCTTAQELQNVILNKYNTVQQLEHNIKNCNFNLLRSIAMDAQNKFGGNISETTDEKHKKEHFQKCILAFYDKTLRSNVKDTQITTDDLLCSPIYKSKEGDLKVWNKIHTKQSSDSFGKPNEEGTYPGWTTMHEIKTWRKIILIIALRFILAFESETDIDAYNKRDDSEELEKIAKIWLHYVTDEETKNEIFDVIGKEMSKKASLTSSLEPHRGWHRLTDVVAEVEYRLHNLVI